MPDRLVIQLNLDNVAPSQYLNHPFTAAVAFNGELVFFGEGGIYEQGGHLDQTTPITAYFDTPLHDFEKQEEQTIEAVTVGYESTGNLEARITPGEDVRGLQIVPLPKVDRASGQQGATKTLRKAAFTKGRYHQVRVTNTDGCDFSLDYLALAPVFYKRCNQP